MRVLLIDKNLVDPLNHRKWEILAEKDDVELIAITPKIWYENFRPISLPAGFKASFNLDQLNVFWPGYENRAFYTDGFGRVMRMVSPDIIICFEEPFSVFALQTLFLKKLYAPKAKLMFYSWDNLAKGKNYAYRPRLFYRVVERIVMKRADLLLTANSEGYSYFSNAYSTRVQRLYFGINLDVPLDKMPSNQVSQIKLLGKFVVGYVGRLLQMKGVDTLIKAVGSLGNDISLVIVGSGPDEQRLKAIVKMERLQDRTVFIPALPSVEVRQLIANLDVLVLPSITTDKWKEQFGRVLVEAMSLGVPVVGSSSGAIPEIIGEAGLVFYEGDAMDLAGKIELLHRDKSLHRRLSVLGKERALEFSAQTFANKMYQLLNELCGLRKPYDNEVRS